MKNGRIEARRRWHEAPNSRATSSEDSGAREGTNGWTNRARAILPVLVGAVLVFAVRPAAAESVKLRAWAALYVDSKGSGLRLPEGVATDGAKLVVVADTGNGRLVTYGIDGKTVTAKGEIALPQVPVPIRVKIDPRGDILALDARVRRIARIGADGAFKSFLELAAAPAAAGATPPASPSAAMAGSVVPRSFDVDARGAVYVLDIQGARILVLGPGGEAEREIAFPERHGFLSDVAVDRKETVYALDSTERRVYAARKGDRALAPIGESLAKEASFPATLAVDGRGWLYVADRNDGGVVLLGMDGSFRGRQLAMGWADGLLRYPGQIAVSAGSGSLFVADKENNRVQIFSSGP